MSDNTYNGWTNRETWVVNLHFGDSEETLQEMVNDANGDLGRLATMLEDWVQEYVDEIVKDIFISDMLNLNDVDWWELAATYHDTYWQEEEEEEDDSEWRKYVEEESAYHQATYPSSQEERDARKDEEKETE